MNSFTQKTISSKDGKSVSVRFQMHQGIIPVVIVDGVTSFHAESLRYLLEYNLHEMNLREAQQNKSQNPSMIEASISSLHGMTEVVFRYPWVEIPLKIDGIDMTLFDWHHLSVLELIDFLSACLDADISTRSPD